jgi:FkbM family methyltransferase
MNKIKTFLRYVKDYLKFGEYYFLWMSIQFILKKSVQPKMRVYNSSLGSFITRKGTLDFQFFNYAYEWNVKRFFLEHYKDYKLFLDIGANVGTYSFMLARKGIVCHAFEPIKENFKSLVMNIKVNKLENLIFPHNFALGATQDKAEFIFESMNTGASHIVGKSDYVELKGEVGIREKVCIKTLDSFLQGIQFSPEDRIIIKIDAEGMEIDVLEGASQFLKTHPHYLIIMESKHSGADKIKEFLDKRGNFIYMEVDHENMAIMK